MTKNQSFMPQKPKPRKTRPDAMPDEMIAAALRSSHGKQIIAADKLGLSMATVSERIAKSPYLQAVREECEERRLDVAELTLDKMVEAENLGAACFLLKTKGKHRGYVENAPVIVSQEIVNQFADMTKEIKAAQEARKIADNSNAK